MKPDQALQIVDQAVAQAHMTRQDHATAMEALRVLAEAIRPQQAEPQQKEAGNAPI